MQTLQESNEAQDDLWKAAELAIKLIPADVDELKQDESDEPRIDHDRRCEILVKLTKKIFSSEKEVLNFYLSKAKSIKSTMLVKIGLESLTVPPDFSQVDRMSRRKYADVYKLFDMMLPIAAGSKSPGVQLSLIESRFKLMHKKPLERAFLS